jgi:hypothetical protein
MYRARIQYLTWSVNVSNLDVGIWLPYVHPRRRRMSVHRLVYGEIRMVAVRFIVVRPPRSGVPSTLVLLHPLDTTISVAVPLPGHLSCT